MTDFARLRQAVQTDPWWAVYALADLAPGRQSHCRWFLSPRDPRAAALLYSAHHTPIFWAQGEPASLAHATAELFASPRLILQIQAPWTRLVQAHYSRLELTPTWRLALHWPSFHPAPPSSSDTRLTLADLPALETLYADGQASGERPPFFFPDMLEQGVFYGASEHGRLIAVAGTHALSAEESAAAIGNVYTRRDARRRGHAARLTSAVAAELGRLGIRTVALSVTSANRAALAVYVRLGFTHHCEFFEGAAAR